jgi:undecaprenyl-diphosphatase
MVIVATLAAGAALAAVATLVVRRWPRIEAPAVAPATVAETVHEHPTLRRVVRSRLDASTLTGLALTVALALVAAGAVAVGVLLIMVRRHEAIANLDSTFANWGAEQSSAVGTDFLRTVSLLGGTAFIVTAAVVVAIIELRSRHALATIGFLILCVGGQFALSNLIKIGVERARPDILPLTGFAGTSFPSGHSTAAAASLAAFALLLTRRHGRKVKVLGAALAVGTAGAVAASRVFLGVHWFTDVLAGLALGWAWFAVCSIAFGGWLLRFGKPVETAEVAEALDPTPPPQPVGAAH